MIYVFTKDFSPDCCHEDEGNIEIIPFDAHFDECQASSPLQREPLMVLCLAQPLNTNERADFCVGEL